MPYRRNIHVMSLTNGSECTSEFSDFANCPGKTIHFPLGAAPYSIKRHRSLWC